MYGSLAHWNNLTKVTKRSQSGTHRDIGWESPEPHVSQRSRIRESVVGGSGGPVAGIGADVTGPSAQQNDSAAPLVGATS